MLELNKLNKIYHLKRTQVHAIKDVTLTMDRGEFISILGESGSGKTTLLSTIGGMEEPTSGTFKIDGIDVTAFSEKKWTDYRKNTIGFIFQDFNLIDHLTAKDNIKLALSLSGNSESDKENRAMALLEKVGMVSHALQYPKQLSGGQQQRVAIARALANEPEIILADEPTGALDPRTAKQIMKILQELAENDHLVIMVTHDDEIANEYSSRIVNIDDGKIVSDQIIKPTISKDYPPVNLKKSSLQWLAALKVANNNLKVRKKSSIFAIMSLVPSMVLVLILCNLVYNLLIFQQDISPIYDNIVNDETLHFISPMSEGQFDRDLKGLIQKVESGTFSQRIVDATEEVLFEPYDQKTIEQIESIPNIEAVIKPNYFDVTIDGHRFILVGLMPEAYKEYQYDFKFDYYPKDFENGLIISQSVADTLGYQVGEQVDFAINNFNSAPQHFEKQRELKNVYHTSILKIFEPETKSAIMSNYYNGYIFASTGYIEKLRADYTIDDISIVSFELVDALDPRAATMKYVPIGSKNMSDLLYPIRSKFASIDDITLFSIRKYSIEAPSNNFGMRHKVITNGPIDDATIERLSEFGHYYSSQYDDVTVSSAIKTNDDVNRLMLFAKITIAVVIILPSLLVGLILFISILLRTKEIGVLKSIGAKSKDIVTIFTLESGILAITSGVIALALTFPAIDYARKQLEIKMDITKTLGSNPLDLNTTAIFSALVGIVILITMLGLLPGRKASKLHPRVLLRRIG